jgi:hypothetical protein
MTLRSSRCDTPRVRTTAARPSPTAPCRRAAMGRSLLVGLLHRARERVPQAARSCSFPLRIAANGGGITNAGTDVSRRVPNQLVKPLRDVRSTRIPIVGVRPDPDARFPPIACRGLERSQHLGVLPRRVAALVPCLPFREPDRPADVVAGTVRVAPMRQPQIRHAGARRDD